MNLGRPGQSLGDIFTDVFRAHVLLKFRLVHELGGLFRRVAKNQLPARAVHLIREKLQGQQPGGIDGSHVAQAQNDHGRELRELMCNLVEFVRRTKQEWAMDIAKVVRRYPGECVISSEE